MPSRSTSAGGISLIIPCYNAAAYVGEALESALGQTVAPDEILVVDDGSTDASAEIVRGFGSRIGYIRQENEGEPSARNLGLARSSGRLIAFLDADDLWPPDSIAFRLQLLDAAPEAHFAFGLTEQFVSPDSTRASGRHPSIAAPLAGATLFRRSAFEIIGGFDPAIRLGAMMDWYSRARHAGMRGEAGSAAVLRRRIHDRNSVHDTARLQQDYLRALRSAARRNRAAQT